MRETLAPVLLGILLLVLTAGCIENIGPPVSADTVPLDAPQSGGNGDYALTIQILDEPEGPSIDDAAIIVYWGSYEGDASGSFQIQGDANGQSAHADAAVRISTQPSTPSPDTTVPLRTGPDGTATANIPSNQPVGIVATADGHTEEWIPQASAGAGNDSGTLALPLYKDRIDTHHEDALTLAGATPAPVTGSNHDWYPIEAPWGETDTAREGYIERLAELRIMLTWSNEPTGGGDLGLGAGATLNDPDIVEDSTIPQSEPGEQTVELVLDKTAIDEMRWPASSNLYLGPLTSSAYAAPLGLPYEMETEARFDPFAQPHRDGMNESPLPTLLVPLLALAALLHRGQRDTS